jgi:hypothetical protein
LLDDTCIEDEPEDNDEASEQSDLDPEDTYLGSSKRRHTGDFDDFEAALPEEPDDYVERCARQAAMAAQKFWASVGLVHYNVKEWTIF